MHTHGYVPRKHYVPIKPIKVLSRYSVSLSFASHKPPILVTQSNPDYKPDDEDHQRAAVRMIPSENSTNPARQSTISPAAAALAAAPSNIYLRGPMLALRVENPIKCIYHCCTRAHPFEREFIWYFFPSIHTYACPGDELSRAIADCTGSVICVCFACVHMPLGEPM